MSPEDKVSHLVEREAAAFDLAIAKLIQIGRHPSEIVAMLNGREIQLVTRQSAASYFDEYFGVELHEEIERTLRSAPPVGTHFVLAFIRQNGMAILCARPYEIAVGDA